ncbi:MAG: D-tyrosyl-tRNA(Tyr) deacylase [Crocinitomicaceae bacterium]|nr:D-tyrosyl-tRNA(Tyr) deacylase [Crocinitomicaceae bacterium]MCF8443840.1 D-tyrosyl-tRNA(Tyr) deacylase [Crocinitomicaceae bacterium]
MRVVIQRVTEASVTINQQIHGQIETGYLVLVGFEENDLEEDLHWISKKIADLRIFSDQDGKMNLSVQDVGGEILLVSQFTLFASTKKGNRPSFIRSASPEIAVPLYDKFILMLNELLPNKIKTGVFGADMKISLINDGPVTMTIDSKARE